MKSLIFVFAFLLVSHTVKASFAVTESFSSASQKLSGDLIWNHAVGHLHPKMEVRGATGVPDTLVDFGDGRHGHFNETRFSQFGTVDTSGPRKILYLDQTRFDPLQVLSFEIPVDWDVIPVGDLPLRIFSLSTVKIFGRLICDGEDGSSPSGAGNVTPGQGGRGRCGGGAGGGGGSGSRGATAASDEAGAGGGGGGGSMLLTHKPESLVE